MSNAAAMDELRANSGKAGNTKLKIGLHESSWVFRSTLKTAEIDSSLARVQLWKRSINDIKARPLGYGFGNAGHIAAQVYGRKYDSKDIANHSTDGWFIKIATESGIPGLISALALLFVSTFAIFKNRAATLKGTYLFICGVFILVNIQNIGSNVLDYFCFAPVYWIVLFLITVKINPANNE